MRSRSRSSLRKNYDLGITWVDWNPTPPIRTRAFEGSFSEIERDVAVRNPFVASKLDAKYRTAELTISGELRNVSNDPVKGVLTRGGRRNRVATACGTERRRIEES